MTAENLALLHEHYRDTCGGMAEQRSKRDRYFYLILVVLAIALFDLTAPEGFATSIADILKTQLGLSTAPDLAYVRSLLWFLLLGLTVRYGQAALGVERLYIYLKELETVLAENVGAGFRREGAAYREYDPLFMTWAHYLYTLVFPLLLAIVVLGWTWQQIPGWPWPFGPTWPLAVAFNCAVTIAILASLGMYLHAFHLYDRRREAKKAKVAK
jgi:hypothetical protein